MFQTTKRGRARHRASCCSLAWARRGRKSSPPIRNIALPLARSGVCGPSARVGTVAGMVMNQKAAKPSTATPAPHKNRLRTFRLLSVREGISPEIRVSKGVLIIIGAQPCSGASTMASRCSRCLNVTPIPVDDVHRSGPIARHEWIKVELGPEKIDEGVHLRRITPIRG